MILAQAWGGVKQTTRKRATTGDKEVETTDYADYTDFFLNLCNLRNLWFMLLIPENQRTLLWYSINQNCVGYQPFGCAISRDRQRPDVVARFAMVGSSDE